jgi:enoyl-CoA hydratase
MMMSKPVIAAITGHAVAGGLELALWCDMRVMEADAVLGVYCRRWGVPLIDGGTVRLPRIVGLGNAMDMILTGRGVTAEEALRMGLVNRVVPRGMALQAARDIAVDLSMFPQACMRNDRMSVYESLDLDFDAAMANEFRRGQDALKEETLEGAQRFTSRKIRPVK